MQSNLKNIVAGVALTLATVTSAYAGNFVNVLNTGARTPGSVNNPATDPFFISSIPSTWTQQASTTTAVYSPVNAAIQVGTFIDTVWLDSSTNSLVIGSYFSIIPNIIGSDIHSGGAITEVNSIVRTGFGSASTVSAAWTYASGVYSGAADGYRLRDPARSDYVATYVAANASTYLDLDKVSIRTDVSPSEGNPNSGIYFLSVDASQFTYQWSDNAVRIVQGASSSEGGRSFAEMWLSGYTIAAVPEPSEYALMLVGVGMLGFVARRRKAKQLS